MPTYQRGYDWTINHIAPLMEDIKYYSENNRDMFLGNLILKESADKKFDIVDGQQRLTTISLLARCVMKRAKEITSGEKEEAYRSSVYHSIYHLTRSIIYKNPTDLKPKSRLEVSRTIKKIYDYIIKEDWDGDFPLNIDNTDIKNESKKIKKIFEEFEKFIGELQLIDLHKIIKVISEAKVAKIIVKDDVEAFYLFETINDRGKNLEIGDLLKNHIFSKLDESEREEYIDNWSKISSNTDNKLTTMLRHFYFTRDGYVGSKQLYESLKKLLNKEYANVLEDKGLNNNSASPEESEKSSADAAKNLYFNIFEYSEFHYSIAVQKNTIHFSKYLKSFMGLEFLRGDKEFIDESIAALRLFNVSQVYPLIYSFLVCTHRLGITERKKYVKEFIGLLVNFHFINYRIGDNRANEIELLFANYSKDFFKINDKYRFSEKYKNLISELKKKLDSREIFISKFTDLTYEPKTRKTIMYIFDKINEYDVRQDNAIFSLYDSTPYDIEHWAPQKPGSNSLEYKLFHDDIGKVYINNIGNLLILHNESNKVLFNKTPQEKYDYIRNNHSLSSNSLNIVKNFFKEYNQNFDKWGKDQIKDRAKKIAELCYDKIWKFQ